MASCAVIICDDATQTNLSSVLAQGVLKHILSTYLHLSAPPNGYSKTVPALIVIYEPNAALPQAGSTTPLDPESGFTHNQIRTDAYEAFIKSQGDSNGNRPNQ